MIDGGEGILASELEINADGLTDKWSEWKGDNELLLTIERAVSAKLSWVVFDYSPSKSYIIIFIIIIFFLTVSYLDLLFRLATLIWLMVRLLVVGGWLQIEISDEIFFLVEWNLFLNITSLFVITHYFTLLT